MIVTLIHKGNLNSITLPDKKEGQFWIGTKTEKDMISIEGVERKMDFKIKQKN